VISRFFIDRPVFAIVLSLVIVLAGGVAVFTLPVAQYPEVTPPTVLVTAIYPGANAMTVRNTVAAPIEEQVSGVENMMYMSSQCTNDGTYTLTVTFRLGMDTDMAQVLVQNRVSLALPVIPALVQNEGINVKKMSPNTMMIVNLLSPDGRYDNTFLSNYATIYIKDEVGRLPGVAGITYLGQRDYSMRAWLDPAKMAALNLSAMDVVNAVGQQNLQVAAGQIGQQPVPKGQQFQLTINTLGRLVDPEQFEDIIIKAGPDDFMPQSAQGGGGGGMQKGASRPGGANFQGGPTDQGGSNSEGGSASQATGIVRLRDVAKVELASRQYDQSCTLDGKPSVAVSIYQLPGSNALETAKGVYAKMRELKTRFPDGLDYQIVYDTTPFIHESVNEVFKTLRDAVILVGIVVLIFLQDWKAMILPMIDVPVSLIGTFAIMAAMGFSLNNLTLFGLVLAIGIVVDDAIVVLENIERLIATGLDSRTATIKAMEEITGPVLAITLVLSSVFIPCCFLGGITGQFFRQFAVTIAVSTIISAINALTMTPSRAVMIFKTEEGSHGHELKREALPWWFFGLVGGILTAWYAQDYVVGQFVHLGLLPELSGAELEAASAWMPWVHYAAAFSPGLVAGLVVGWSIIRPVNAVLGWLFRGFNRLFDKMTNVYGRIVAGVLRISVIVLMLYGGLLGLTYWEFVHTPTGFVPQQDKGYLLLNVQLPDSASTERTQRIMARIETLARQTPGVAHTVGVSGQSLLLNANAPNLGSLYVMLEEFHKRRPPNLTGCDLRLMPAADDVSEMPAEGKSLIVVALVDQVLHFRIFDGDGKMVVYTYVRGQTEEAQPIEELWRQLESLWPPHELTGSEKDRVIAAVTSIVGHTHLTADAISAVLTERCQREARGAIVTAFGAPPIDGLGTTGGFKLIIEDRGNLGVGTLQRISDQIVERGNKTPGLQGLFNSSRANTPWLYLSIDRTKCMALGVPVSELFNTLQVYLGSYYVNNFNQFGRSWQVNIQADQNFRGDAQDIRQLQVRNNKGQMIRLATLLDVSNTSGPVSVMRYNMYASTAITGNPAPGTSSGQAIAMMQEIADQELKLTRSMATDWTELAYMQLQAGNTATGVFALAVVFVFLVLAAQYESWKLPLAVILVVPMCLLCSLIGVNLVGMDVSLFTQIGFVVLVGLASKNAILIVEFAKQSQDAGVPRREATIEACRLRLRPILMTSFAFIFGVLPLVIAEGAGAEMRRSLGTAVFSGMLGVTAFGIFLTPVFYYVIQWFGDGKKPVDLPHGPNENGVPANGTIAQLAEPVLAATHPFNGDVS
jgi:multidrug efflux pump subunit AcrB